MTSQIAGTVIGGALTLDERLELPDQTRVKITIEPVETKRSPVEAWESLRAWIHENPLHGLGRHLTRDELHERR